MADAAFTARATTKAHVAAKIGKLRLPTVNGQYTHDAAIQFTLGVNRVLKSTFNPSEPGQGMARLLRSSTDATNPSTISAIKSTDAANIDTILRDSAAEATATQRASSNPNVTVPPTITTRPDAIDAADRANNLTQSVIGAKEGATEAVTAKVGARV